MGRSLKLLVVFFTLFLLLAVSLPVMAAPSGRDAAAGETIIMCGRSVMENWFAYWGWDWDD
ncbi:MAG: hypothetical protein JXA49_01775, partial [Actinobacteria bacterium]|nr:hypothetical protein [Actinomycetota bacterium]